MRMGAESQVKLPQAEDASMARRPAEAGKGGASSSGGASPARTLVLTFPPPEL